MLPPLKILSRVLAIAVPIALGVVAVTYSGALKSPPASKVAKQPPTQVRVLTMQPIDLAPRVIGHGAVMPARTWRAVARIEGEVVATSPQLASGEIVARGVELLRIDDTDILLSLAQIDAQLAALTVRDETLAASLEISRSDLALSREDLQRRKDLMAQGVTTQVQLEQAQRVELTARAKVTEVTNQLALTAAERRVLQAQRASAARSLEFTTITAPYDMRLVDVQAEIGQVVNRGQTLFSAEGIDAVEIAAQFSIGQIGPLIRTLGDSGSVMALTARVRMVAAGHAVVWNATVDRTGDAIDARTQSTAIVVRVDQPVTQAEAGKRPPLRRNMFVEVILSTPKRSVLAAPLDVVRDGWAFIVTPGGKLEKREITVGYSIGNIAVVTAGLAEGDKLVVSDLAIAMPGMAVKPVEDKSTKAMIAKLAGGGKGKSE